MPSYTEVTEKKMVVLRSSDQVIFEIDESVAFHSQLIKNAIEDDCAEPAIHVPNVTSKILAKVIEYCKRHAAATTDKVPDGTLATTDKVADGTPATTDKVADGTLATTDKVVDGTPATTNKVANGTPATTNKVANGIPTTTNKVADGTPTTTNKVADGTPYTTEKVSVGTTYTTEKVAVGTTDKVADEDLKAFDAEFVKVDESILVELMKAANNLNIKCLVELICQTLAEAIKDMTVNEVRQAFKIENDFTQQEEEEVQKENAWAYE
ncbi:SKP1-like protein 12 [Forsythia ovata]|uniref:SKP1-like protein 12 n=1 Tax=Forsythia ovata TaxID=205694 RepID=A0ABD1QL81_9LAMI